MVFAHPLQEFDYLGRFTALLNREKRLLRHSKAFLPRALHAVRQRRGRGTIFAQLAASELNKLSLIIHLYFHSGTALCKHSSNGKTSSKATEMPELNTPAHFEPVLCSSKWPVRLFLNSEGHFQCRPSLAWIPASLDLNSSFWSCSAREGQYTETNQNSEHIR